MQEFSRSSSSHSCGRSIVALHYITSAAQSEYDSAHYNIQTQTLFSPIFLVGCHRAKHVSQFTSSCSAVGDDFRVVTIPLRDTETRGHSVLV